jgi:hypothetical protein
MTDITTPRLRVEDWIARMRGEVQRQRGDGATHSRSMPRLEWSELQALLEDAETNAHTGTALPPMNQQHGWKRRIVRGVAQGILLISRFLTGPQRDYNRALLKAVHHVGYACQRLEAVVAEQAARLEALQREIDRLKAGGPLPGGGTKGAPCES